MRTKLFRTALWLIQIASLVVVLICAWRLLETELFALVAGSVSLFAALYAEHTLIDGSED